MRASPAPPRVGSARPFLRVALEATDRHRWVTAAAGAGVATALALAWWGLPPVDLHGPLHHLGLMDFLCGGTRAAHATVTGRWDLAWYYNPLGPLAVVAAAATVTRAVVGVLTRRWVTLHVAWTTRRTRVVVWLFLVLATVLTVRQQLMVDVLAS